MAEELRDDAEIGAFLGRWPDLYLYEIGDLDPFARPLATYHGVRAADGRLRAISLLYDGVDPTWLLLGRDDLPAMEALIGGLQGLPPRVYIHAAPAVLPLLEAAGWRVATPSDHLKMSLRAPDRLPVEPDPRVAALSTDDSERVHGFYARAYPGNWYDPRMLATGRYVGLEEDGALRAIAGVHVWSTERRVAALGNIATDPAHRGRGLGTAVTAALCLQLRHEVHTIGLNVAADNHAAIRCYERLGFGVVADYVEGFAER